MNKNPIIELDLFEGSFIVQHYLLYSGKVPYAYAPQMDDYVVE